MNADPVQLVDRLQPPEGWSERTDLAADPVAAQLLERVFADTGKVVSLDTERRRRRGIAGTVVVAALIAGGAVAALWNRSPEQTLRVACWSEPADPPERRVAVPWDGRSDPAELCATRWAEGAFEPEPPPPELQVCVTDNDVAAVIPADDSVCRSLGFREFVAPPVVPSPDDAQRELDAILRPTSECVQGSDAETIVRDVLVRNGLVDWEIKVDDTTSVAETCATVALQPEMSTAFVRWVPRPG